jgi:hypothetical protein
MGWGAVIALGKQLLIGAAASAVANAVAPKPSAPKPEPAPEAPTTPTTDTTQPDQAAAAEEQRKKDAAKQGYNSTIQTGYSGDQSTANTGRKTLLGSSSIGGDLATPKKTLLGQ